MTIIALGGIAVTAGAPSSLVQLASATDVTTTTMGGQEGGEEGATTDSTTTTNNISNAVLGSLFLKGTDTLTSFNPINESYTEVSYAGNRTLMPLDTTTEIINATEPGNLTINLQPNGITIVKGQSLLATKAE